MLETESYDGDLRLLLGGGESLKAASSSISRSRFRALSASRLASSSSATPFLDGHVSMRWKWGAKSL
jgi:hypothetical protein